MEKVAIDDVDPSTYGDDAHRRDLAGALGGADIAINHYRLAPGEGFPGGLHAHTDQEEAFVVREGTATFETLGPARGDDANSRSSTEAGGATDRADESAEPTVPAEPGREVTVRAGEAVRFAPGEFQSGRNDADEVLVAVAIGAPRHGDDVRIPLRCPTCGRSDLRLETSGERPLLACPGCGAEHVPGACPSCGREDVRAALDDAGRPVARCHDCGASFEESPIRD